MKYQEPAAILDNRQLSNLYYRLDFHAPQIAGAAMPGQFIHVRVPFMEHRILRRPFSIFDTDRKTGRTSIIYKIVGEGTEQLARLSPDTPADLLGPLGHGFTCPPPATAARPVIVAGGYGCAATYLLAKLSPSKPLCLFGARTAADLLLVEEFHALGCEVRIATDDGSVGHRGFVTHLLAEHMQANPDCAEAAVYACGPNPMLRAVAELVAKAGRDAEISLDHAMCCGVGACFACVVRIRQADAPDGWHYARTCSEGPVFRASQTLWP